MKKKYKKQIKKLLILLVISIIAYFGADNKYINKGLSFIESKIEKTATQKPTIISGKKLSGKITKVSDGDTVTLTDNNGKKYKIRLNGIDCPEMNQEYGNEARKYVEKIASGKYADVDVIGKDQYNRILGILYIGKLNVNETLLKNGMAWVYKYNKDSHYKKMEEQARIKKLNLWKNPNAIDPYMWRKTGKKSK